MRSLLSKNQSQFFLYTTITLIACAPLFFLAMKFSYTKDLGELIRYRSAEFRTEKLPGFSIPEIEVWNKYNEDVQILPYDDTRESDKTVDEFLFNKSEGHNIYYRIVYNKIEVEGRPYTLMSRVPMIEDRDLVMNLLAQYGLIFAIILFSLNIVQRRISKKTWVDFYSTLNKIENYSLEQGDVPRFDKTDIREFARLNEIISTLIRRNLAVYKQQKEFIENASHELQTPLAVFQAKLDILLQDPDLTRSQGEMIQYIYNTSSRMARLNKNLLLLAKIGNSQFRERRDIDFGNLLNTQLEYFKSLAEGNGLKVTVEISDPPIVNASPTLLESLINNLIANAIRHNTPNGSILVSVDGNTFSVANTGDANPLRSDRIFRRFSRTSEEKEGNGLGLAIVSQICEFHKWSVEYVYKDGMHVFVVRFSPVCANKQNDIR